MANGTRNKPILCAKNSDQMKKLEKKEDCFILEFDPCYDEINISKLSVSKVSDVSGSTDLSVVAEKGQVACRDYPHSRHNCAKYPFDKTPHDHHCELCYCYVCDSAAPCPKWVGYNGHSHAFNTDLWNKKREERKLKVASGEYPHFRHNCTKYAFDNTPHGSHCMQCYCYVCDSAAPCANWVGSSGHCHAFKSEMWDKKREDTKLKVARRELRHFRHICAKYPFDKTHHQSHCNLCYCYVCDLAAPCPNWFGSSGHCHAFNTETWNKKREECKLLVAIAENPHFRHNCVKYPFDKTPHDHRCNLCNCYICDSVAPCPKWVGYYGHCHAFSSESWNKKREEMKLKVASGDHPHFRYNCVKYAFSKTPHDNHCMQCYCYVCDSAAPCANWIGSVGHCHAFKSERWDKQREETKLKVANRELRHFRHICTKYPFNNTPHQSHCKLCYCYVCDSAAPCPIWVGSSGHCHAFNNETWNKKREERKLLVSAQEK